MHLKLDQAHKSPGYLVNGQSLIQQLWHGAWDSGFLTSSQVRLMLLVYRTRFTLQGLKEQIKFLGWLSWGLHYVKENEIIAMSRESTGLRVLHLGSSPSSVIGNYEIFIKTVLLSLWFPSVLRRFAWLPSSSKILLVWRLSPCLSCSKELLFWQSAKSL